MNSLVIVRPTARFSVLAWPKNEVETLLKNTNYHLIPKYLQDLTPLQRDQDKLKKVANEIICILKSLGNEVEEVLLGGSVEKDTNLNQIENDLDVTMYISTNSLSTLILTFTQQWDAVRDKIAERLKNRISDLKIVTASSCISFWYKNIKVDCTLAVATLRPYELIFCDFEDRQILSKSLNVLGVEFIKKYSNPECLKLIRFAKLWNKTVLSKCISSIIIEHVMTYVYHKWSDFPDFTNNSLKTAKDEDFGVLMQLFVDTLVKLLAGEENIEWTHIKEYYISPDELVNKHLLCTDGSVNWIMMCTNPTENLLYVKKLTYHERAQILKLMGKYSAVVKTFDKFNGTKYLEVFKQIANLMRKIATSGQNDNTKTTMLQHRFEEIRKGFPRKWLSTKLIVAHFNQLANFTCHSITNHSGITVSEDSQNKYDAFEETFLPQFLCIESTPLCMYLGLKELRKWNIKCSKMFQTLRKIAVQSRLAHDLLLFEDKNGAILKWTEAILTGHFDAVYWNPYDYPIFYESIRLKNTITLLEVWQSYRKSMKGDNVESEVFTQCQKLTKFDTLDNCEIQCAAILALYATFHCVFTSHATKTTEFASIYLELLKKLEATVILENFMFHYLYLSILSQYVLAHYIECEKFILKDIKDLVCKYGKVYVAPCWLLCWASFDKKLADDNTYPFSEIYGLDFGNLDCTNGREEFIMKNIIPEAKWVRQYRSKVHQVQVSLHTMNNGET